MYSYIAVVVPTVPNLFVRFLKQLQKVITGLVLIIRWRTLEYLRVITIRKETDLRWCVVVLSFLLTSTWMGLIFNTIIIVCVHEFMYTDWFAQAIRRQIYSTRGYSY
jgi:type III secretory pathway component EscU